MWCYQKPGFEALLLAELQRQQQCSQFCDTLLKAEGVSVPAHSCVLSAVSPQMSSALSSTPPPPPGQSRLLDFRALGACTLLHMVSLLYSGEMAGEGEREKQEAVAAAAKLGIRGLVEVTGRGDRHGRREEEAGRRAEVGVQTLPVASEEGEGRRVRWRRDMGDGETLLWKETPSDGDKDTPTQTEELLVNTAPSFETIDLAAFQSLGQTDPNPISTPIPYVPVSVVYPPDQNQARQPSSAPVDYLQRSAAAGQTPVVVVAPPYTSGSSSTPSFSGQANPCAQSWWAGPQGADAGGESEEEETLMQFQDDIPGYISYFLNPDTEEDSRRGRARGRRRSRVASASGAGTGERRPRTPRARARQRRRGGLTQTVDVQEVGVSRLQKLFLQRSGRRASKTGQGGGAAGRSLCVKTRELLKPPRSCRRRRVLDTFLEVSPSRDVLPRSERGAGNAKRGSKRATPQSNRDDPPVSRPRRSRAKPASPPLSSPPMQSYNVRTLWASSPSHQPSPSPGPLSSAASCVPSASACPPAPPPHEEQRDRIDRLLEEVLMELDIFPKNNNDSSSSAPQPRPRPLPPADSSSRTSVDALARDTQQSRVVAVERGAAGSHSANSEVQILQEQGEGDLESILLSFERHIESCGRSCSAAPVSSSGLPERQRREEDEALARRSRPLAASPGSPAPDTHVERSAGKVTGKRRQKRRKKACAFSSEKKKVRRPGSASDTATNMLHDPRDRRLQQMPVVKLERRGAPPVRVTLQGHGSQSPDVKNIAKTKSSLSVKSRDENQTVWWSTKTYPIRSKFKALHTDIVPILEESHPQSKGSPSAGQTGQLPSLSNDESPTPPVQPQAVEPCGAEKQMEIYEERQEQEVTLLSRDEAEAPTRRGKKRGAEAEERTSDDGAVAKRVCFERMPEQSSDACTPRSESAETGPAGVVHADTVSRSSVLPDEKPAWTEIKPRKTERLLTREENESSDEEIIDVDGEFDDGGPGLLRPVEMKSSLSPPSHSEVSREADEDEEVDVVGGCSPAPEPVIVNWTESSEGEDEDEDVGLVGQQTSYTSSAVPAAISTR